MDPFLPPAPVNSTIGDDTDLVVTIVMGAFAAAALIFSLVYWARTGRPTFLVLFLAGGTMMAFEPLVDTVGAVWFQEDATRAFVAYGRPIPVWLCLAYFFYFGIGVGVDWLWLRQGFTKNKIWILFGAGLVGDMLFEMTLLAFDTYIYYGDQPLVLLNFPMWWAPVNALIVVMCACAVYRFEPWLGGWRSLQIIPLAMVCSAAGNAAAGWTSWFVINTEVTWVLTQVGGLLTFAFAIWIVYCLTQVMAATEPPGAKRARKPAKKRASKPAAKARRPAAARP